jgi:gag-polyprotein putative aspartyl protease
MQTAGLLPDRCCRWKRCCFRGGSGLIAGCLFLSLVIALPNALAAQIKQANEVIKFRLRDGYLIVVQTMVNGSGPFSFLLDTGSTRTVIDPDLARQLQAPAVGEAAVTTVLHYRQDKLVRLQEVGLGEASVSGLGAIVDKLARQKLLAPGIRGVLGEDFLSRFDVLIDYKQRSLRFGDSPPAGERCRFERISQYRGSPTINRLLIPVEFLEVSGEKVQLQLDTGAKTPELFPVSHDSHSSQPWGGFMATSNGANGITIHSNITLRIGTTMVPGQDVVQSRRAVAFDAIGLLPAAIFHRIYISHSGGFVVLNPPE